MKEELVRLGIIMPKETIKRETINNPVFFRYVTEKKDKICSLNPLHSSGEVKDVAKESNGRVLKYESSRGNIQYLYNGRQIGFFNQCFHEVDGESKLSILLGDLWNDIDFGNNQNEGGVDFPGGKKPEALLARIIDMTTNENDIILDFHLGSGTTAAVALKMGRKFIGIDQMDYIQTIAIERLKNVLNGENSGVSKRFNWQGGGSFVYCELAAANQNFVDEIFAAESTDDLKKIWERMQQTGFLSWKVEPKQFEENAKAFEELSLDDQKLFLVECLDKNLLYIPLSEVDNDEFGLDSKDRELTRKFYAM